MKIIFELRDGDNPVTPVEISPDECGDIYIKFPGLNSEVEEIEIRKSWNDIDLFVHYKQMISIGRDK